MQHTQSKFRRGETKSLSQLLPQLIPLSVGKRIVEDLATNGPYDHVPVPFVKEVSCLECRDTGELAVKVEACDPNRTFRPCDKCGAADRLREGQYEKLRAKFSTLGLKLPRKYDDYTWENWPGSDVRSLARFKRLAKAKPCSVLVLGRIGVGKTSAVSCLYREWERELPGLWCAVPDLLDHIRKGYDPAVKAYKASELVDAVSTAPLVVFDDIGPENVTAFVEEAFYRIVSRRDDEKRATIFTTNLTLSGLEEHCGGRTASRIEGMAASNVLIMLGDDIRKRGRPAPPPTPAKVTT